MGGLAKGQTALCLSHFLNIGTVGVIIRVFSRVVLCTYATASPHTNYAVVLRIGIDGKILVIFTKYQIFMPTTTAKPK